MGAELLLISVKLLQKATPLFFAADQFHDIVKVAASANSARWQGFQWLGVNRAVFEFRVKPLPFPHG